MSGLLALSLAVLAFAAFAPAFRKGTPRLVFLTLIPCFGFWYWLPAFNLLTFGKIGLDNFAVTESVDEACWLVLINQLATLALLRLTLPMFEDGVAPRRTQFPPALFAHFSLALGVIYLAMRFSDQGIDLLTAMATGQISARTEMDFANHSPGAAASLIELLGIIVVWTSLFSLGCHVMMRRVLTLGGIETLAALTLMFVGSATRAILLQAMFVGLMATIVRPRRIEPQPAPTLMRAIAYSLPFAALGAAIGGAFIARFQADPGYAAEGMTEALISTVVVNNDMMRELAFALDNIPPSYDGAGDFMKLPFVFMLPTFLGFHKEIPEYDVLFAQLRAGIDVETMGGNVFPGLVGDFWMVFGRWMPIPFAVFVFAFAIVLHHFSRTISGTQARLAYCLAMLSYLFFSFRNIHGGLVLVGIIGAILLWIVCALFARSEWIPSGAENAPPRIDEAERSPGDNLTVQRSTPASSATD